MHNRDEGAQQRSTQNALFFIPDGNKTESRGEMYAVNGYYREKIHPVPEKAEQSPCLTNRGKVKMSGYVDYRRLRKAGEYCLEAT
jgi:hypothetical protein